MSQSLRAVTADGSEISKRTWNNDIIRFLWFLLNERYFLASSGSSPVAARVSGPWISSAPIQMSPSNLSSVVWQWRVASHQILASRKRVVHEKKTSPRQSRLSRRKREPVATPALETTEHGVIRDWRRTIAVISNEKQKIDTQTRQDAEHERCNKRRGLSPFSLSEQNLETGQRRDTENVW